MSDLKAVEKKLRDRLDVLKDRMEEISEDLGELGDDDFQEMAIESEGDEVLESVGRLADVEARQILLALERISLGTYGRCPKCGKAIAPARLEAVPHAVFCITCAE